MLQVYICRLQKLKRPYTNFVSQWELLILVFSTFYFITCLATHRVFLSSKSIVHLVEMGIFNENGLIIGF